MQETIFYTIPATHYSVTKIEYGKEYPLRPEREMFLKSQQKGRKRYFSIIEMTTSKVNHRC